MGFRYAPMAAGSSARAARDARQRGFHSLLFAARCLSNLFTLSGKRYAVTADLHQRGHRLQRPVSLRREAS